MKSRTKAGIHTFRVIGNDLVAKDMWHMVCHTSVAGVIEPGQFVNLRVPGDGSHVLRIPLSFSHADASDLQLEFLYAVVGEGTRRLSMMRVGDQSTLVGPTGRGWWMPEGEGRSLLVAGGAGLAPIVACARMLASCGRPFDVVVGALTASRHVAGQIDLLRALPLKEGTDCLRKVIVVTDDGSLGLRGYATDPTADLIAARSYEQLYTCGPQPMMAAVAKIAHKAHIPCQCSLERMMACGFGACSCCNVALASGGYALCCQDGPVFDSKEVAW